MKARKLTLIMAVSFIALMACEKIIDIDIPDADRKIVLNGIINQDQLVQVNVSRSLSVLEDDQFIFLDNAEVRLFEDDKDKGILQYIGSGDYQMAGLYPKINSLYRIEVESPGLNTVSASSVLPDIITFSEIDTLSTQDEWGYSSLKLSFSLDDPVTENYYALSLKATYRYFDYNTNESSDSLVTSPQYFEFLQNGEGGIQDILIEDNASIRFVDKIFMTDQLFNGKSFNLDLTIGKYFFPNTDTVWLDVSLQHITRDYYLYVASLKKYDQADGNPFAEAVSVFTNVDKGLGIFSSYTAFTRRITMLVDGRR